MMFVGGVMSIVFRMDNNIDDDIVILYKKKNDVVDNLEKYCNNIKMIFYKREQEYYLDLNEIIFFETDINNISAHTINDVYNIKYKLYELEQMLPNNFVRVAKSTIVNINNIRSIKRNITSSSLIEFYNTYKKVYVSRFYYKNLKERLKER